ncbi:unnamed protein product [Orchesella dallaii]|uniref:C2H2-type domain-containing protein n=1 Tax=Orchesella dallaii TaxID=48710 RepID=A0ABP1RMV3_9HEXA
MNPIFKHENDTSSVMSNEAVSIEQEELSEGIPPLLIDLTNSGANVSGSQSPSSSSARSGSQYSPYVSTNPLRDSEIRALFNFMGKQEEINHELFENLENFKEEMRMEMNRKNNQIASLQHDVDELKKILEENGIYLKDIKDNRQKLSAKRKHSEEGEMRGEENNVKRIRNEYNSSENQIESDGISEATLAAYYQADSARNEEAKEDDDDHERLHEIQNLEATGTFECLEWNCMLTFDDKLLRNLHLNSAHGYVKASNGSLRCTTDECGKDFTCLESCWEHKKSEHQ